MQSRQSEHLRQTSEFLKVTPWSDRDVGDEPTPRGPLEMQKILALKLGALVLGTLNLALCASAASAPALSQSLPQSTAIPVRFDHSVDAKDAKAGDTIIAKTMQVIVLPGGETIAKGTTIVGHVVAVQAFQFDPAPYAHQKPSLISIRFDKLQNGNSVIPVNLSVRAIASTIDSDKAARPHYLDETDRVGTITLIGGTEFTPRDKMIQADNGDAIGYNRKNGVFARLTSSGYSGPGASFHCEGTESEQSVAIYSPNACGVYGFDGDYLADNGRDGSGTFTLAVRGRSEKLYAGSTALLQVNGAK
jgi:hypothetical protein